MNEKERIEFDSMVNFMYRNMGDEHASKLRTGIEYLRGIEHQYLAVCRERDELWAEFARWKAESAELAKKNAERAAGECSVPRCRKSGLCPNWEPEPQAAGAEEGALVKVRSMGVDTNKATDIMPVVKESEVEKVENVEKKAEKGFIARLFGR